MSDLPGILLLGLRFLLVFCLYLFLAWAVRVIWQDLRQARTVSRQQAINPLELTITTGSVGPVTHVLSAPENILGRGPNCEISMPDETVSSRHARFFYEHKQWWLQDLGSSNGTYLNEIPLEQPAVLADLDQIRFGRVTAEIRLNQENIFNPEDFLEGIES